jgi:hypothetical protein
MVSTQQWRRQSAPRANALCRALLEEASRLCPRRVWVWGPLAPAPSSTEDDARRVRPPGCSSGTRVAETACMPPSTSTDGRWDGACGSPSLMCECARDPCRFWPASVPLPSSTDDLWAFFFFGRSSCPAAPATVAPAAAPAAAPADAAAAATAAADGAADVVVVVASEMSVPPDACPADAASPYSKYLGSSG